MVTKRIWSLAVASLLFAEPVAAATFLATVYKPKMVMVGKLPFQVQTHRGLAGTLNSSAVLESIPKSVLNDGTRRPTPTKTDYTWRYYAGSQAANVRLHFSKFDLAPGDRLEIQDGSGRVVQTLRGRGPAGGWSNPVWSPSVRWRLVTTNATGAQGFAIDQVSVLSLAGKPDSAQPISETNTEWHGAIGTSGGKHYYVFEVTKRGKHDVYLRGTKPYDVSLFRGLRFPSGPFLIEYQSTLGPELSTYQLGGRPTIVNTSRLITATLDPGFYTVMVRAGAGVTGPYTLMVNRVEYELDVEIELDGFGRSSIPQRVCQLKHLFREATERLYGATDGYIRFRKIYYFTDTNALNAVDAQVNNEDLRAHSPIKALSWFMHLSLGFNHLNHYRSHGRPQCGGSSTPSRNGAATFVHEWGHYDFGLWDEYADGEGSKCPSSLMGSSQNRQEFCTALSHDPLNLWGPWSAFTQGDDSGWYEIGWKYQRVPERTKTPNPHSFVGTAIGNTVTFRENLTCDNWPIVGPTGFGPDCD